MTKLISYLVLAYFVYSIWKLISAVRRRASVSRPKPRPSGLMVKDESCGIYLPREEALREVHDGHEVFFCSKECRTKFLKIRREG